MTEALTRAMGHVVSPPFDTSILTRLLVAGERKALAAMAEKRETQT